LATRTSGPTRATSPHANRLGAGAAVAGINRPPALLRSPLSGVRTTRRSPVSLIAAPFAVVLVRAFRFVDVFVDVFLGAADRSTMAGV